MLADALAVDGDSGGDTLLADSNFMKDQKNYSCFVGTSQTWGPPDVSLKWFTISQADWRSGIV